MAKQKNIFHMEGSLGDLNFYHHKVYGFLVRRKGGVSGKRMKNDRSFARARENAQEFGMLARAGKLIRQAVKSAFPDYKDSTVTSRLAGCLAGIKVLDDVHIRGERCVSKGLTLPEGRRILQQFNFCAGNALPEGLRKRIYVDAATGVLELPLFQPPEDLACPEVATHVVVGGLCSRFDFSAGDFTNSVSGMEVRALDSAVQNLQLNFLPPAGGGTVLVFIQIRFLQEVNGALYTLDEGKSVWVVH